MSEHLMIADAAARLGTDHAEWAVANGLARRAGEEMRPHTDATWVPESSWLFASPLDEDPNPTPESMLITGAVSRASSLHHLPIFGAMWKADGQNAAS